MNDFNKEELNHFYDALSMLSKLGWVKSDINYCKRIQEMIDNYDAKTIKVWHCEKCGHVQ